MELLLILFLDPTDPGFGHMFCGFQFKKKSAEKTFAGGYRENHMLSPSDFRGDKGVEHFNWGGGFPFWDGPEMTNNTRYKKDQQIQGIRAQK